MAEVTESSVDQIQQLSLQDGKQTQGEDFVNGISSPDNLEGMDAFGRTADDKLADDSLSSKQTNNGDFSLDPCEMKGQDPDLLSGMKDQQVPQNFESFEPFSEGSSVDQPSHQQPSGADDMLIDIEGKGSPKPHLVPGMQRFNPFVQSNELDSTSSNPFLSDHTSAPPVQLGGETEGDESMECHQEHDESPCDDSSLTTDSNTTGSLTQKPDLLMMEEGQGEPSTAQFGMPDMEFESNPSMFDQSLSNVDDISERKDSDILQAEAIQPDESGDQAQDVIQEDVAQSVLQNVPEDSAAQAEVTTTYERKVSHDDQIVPGVCSCIEPEPTSSGSGSEEDYNEEMEVVHKTENNMQTPEIRLQSADNEVVAPDTNMDDNVDGDDNAYCDDESDGDELTPSENITRSGEGEMAVMSDPGVMRRGDDEYYSDDGEGGEIYTDESYSDGEYDEGEEAYRGSEEREISSEYSEEGPVRSSSEREVSPLVGAGTVKEAFPSTGEDEGKEGLVSEGLIEEEKASTAVEGAPGEMGMETEDSLPQNQEEEAEDYPHEEEIPPNVSHEGESQMSEEGGLDEGVDQTEEGMEPPIVVYEPETEPPVRPCEISEIQAVPSGEEPEESIDQADEEVLEQLESAPDLALSGIKTPEPRIEPLSDVVGPQSDVVEPQSDLVNPQSDVVEPQSDRAEPQISEHEQPEVPDVEHEQMESEQVEEGEEVIGSSSQMNPFDQVQTEDSEVRNDEFVEPAVQPELQSQQIPSEIPEHEGLEREPQDDEDQFDQMEPQEPEPQPEELGPEVPEDQLDQIKPESEEPFSEQMELQVQDQVDEHVDKAPVSNLAEYDQSENQEFEQKGLVEPEGLVKPEGVVEPEGLVEREGELRTDVHETEKDDETRGIEDLGGEGRDREDEIITQEAESLEGKPASLPQDITFEDKSDQLAAVQQEDLETAHPFPVTPQGVPPPITPEANGQEMLPGVVSKMTEVGVEENGEVRDLMTENGHPEDGDGRGEDEGEILNHEADAAKRHKDVLKRGDSVVIESEGSDMEERSITPDPDHILQMQEKLLQDQKEMTMMEERSGQEVGQETGQDLMSSSMHESIHLEEGQGVEDLVQYGRESGPMDGSFILEEGQTVEDIPESGMTSSAMEGSLIMEHGQTIEDLEESVEQEPSEGSPGEEIPPQMSRSAMEDSIVLEEGQTFDDHPAPDLMTGSMMEGSMVLGEGETFEDQQQEDESSTTEGQQPSCELNAMSGSMILDEGEQLDDSLPHTETSRSAMEGSMVAEEGESVEERLLSGPTKMSASFSESYSESQAEDTSLRDQAENMEEEPEVEPTIQPQRVSVEEESRFQREAAQNMVENVLNDAIDKVESMQKVTMEGQVQGEVRPPSGEVKVEKEAEHVVVKEETKTEKVDVEKKEEKKKSKTVTEKRVGKVKTKTEKEKKNESVVVKESKKIEKKTTEVKKERPKSAVTRSSGDDVFSRLYQDSSKRIERARKSPEKPEQETKIPSPTKADIPKRSASASRHGRQPQRSPDNRGGESPEKKEARSKSTPRPYTAPGARRVELTISTARASRPTQLHRPKKDASSDSGVEEDKNARQSSATSQKKKYGIDAKNQTYKPGGGHVKIFDKKVQVKATSRIDAGSKTPPGGTKPVNGSPKKESPRPKPTTPKGASPNVKNVSSRIGSLDNAKHTPGGGKVQVTTKKTDYSKVGSRIGSTANMDHKPGGGDKKIQSQKLEWKTGSRVGSLDNAKHSPGGGNVKIQDERLDWKVTSRVGSMDNAKHSPGGGNVKIENRKLDFKDKAHSKVGSTDNIGHKAQGGTKKIETQKLDFKDKAKPRVDAKSDHKPGGGDKKVSGIPFLSDLPFVSGDN